MTRFGETIVSLHVGSVLVDSINLFMIGFLLGFSRGILGHEPVGRTRSAAGAPLRATMFLDTGQPQRTGDEPVLRHLR